MLARRRARLYNRAMKVFLAITGASGVIYGVRTLRALLERDAQVTVAVTPDAAGIIGQEMGVVFKKSAPDWRALLGLDPKTLTYEPSLSYWSPVASGSNAMDAYLIVPCSMGMLGRIASGTSDNLIARAADVALKERRRLIVVPREAPYSLLHLENMVRITRAGGTILPASPNFYGRPQTIDDLVDTIVKRILSHLGFDTGPGWRPPAAD